MALAATLALLASGTALARDPQGSGQPGPGPAPAPPAGGSQPEAAPAPVVQIDVAELVDGRESPHNLATYYIRKKLRELGFRPWSTRMLTVFRKEHDEEAARARERGEQPPALLEELRPEPELIVRGTVRVEHERSSNFYGEDLAFIYRSQVDLVVLDASGKELDRIAFTDEWGRRDRKTARLEAMKRAGLFASADVLASQAIVGRANEQQKAAIQEYVARINQQRGEGGR